MARSTAHWTFCTFTSGEQGWRIQVDCASGWTDWPIQYEDGSIAYDFPERIPASVKRQVERLYRIGAPVSYFGVVKTNGEKELLIRKFATKEEAVTCINRLMATATPTYWYEIRPTEKG